MKSKDEKKLLVWNSTVAIRDGFCLCFLWQDNNDLIAITTAHSLHRQEDEVTVNRRRPKPTSTNARNVLPVAGNNAFKELSIPKAIDDYNKRMGAVDNTNNFNWFSAVINRIQLNSGSHCSTSSLIPVPPMPMLSREPLTQDDRRHHKLFQYESGKNSQDNDPAEP